jgi:mono/diheme cytochrome c family protein
MRFRSVAVALLLPFLSCEPSIHPEPEPGFGTAPSVQLLRPNGGETLNGSTEIAWTASDPDPGDIVTIDLELVEVGAGGSGSVARTLAAGLPNTPSSYTWNASGVPATRDGQPIQYRIRVVARDRGGLNVRSDESDAAFTVAAPPTSYTWAHVRPVFLANCASCHGELTTVPPAPGFFRLDKYDASDPVAPGDTDLGVYEMRDRVYQRMVVLGTMPPAHELQQPTADEIAMIANWIDGGAPR